jgi:hypothetical protein
MIRFIFVSLVLILSSTAGLSQGSVSVDFFVFVGNSERILFEQTEIEDETIYIDNIINQLKLKDSRKLSGTLGIAVNKGLSDKVFLRTGLSFSSFAFSQSNDDSFQWPSQHDGNGGFDSSVDPGESLSDRINFSTSYWFIDLPIGIRKEFGCKKLSPYLEGGLSINYYLTTRSVQHITEKEVSFNRNESIKTMNVFGYLSAGLNYQVKESWQTYFQLGFSQQINSLTSELIKERLNRYGIEVGFRKMINSSSS